MPSEKFKIFISYARSDKPSVRDHLVPRPLHGTEYLWDHLNIAGDDWKAQLDEWIRECDAFFFIISRESIESDWCRWEYNLANQLQKPIVPLLLRQVKEETLTPKLIEFFARVKKLQFVDFTHGLENLDAHYSLVNAVSKLIINRPTAVVTTKARVSSPKPPGLPSVYSPIASDPYFALPDLNWIQISAGVLSSKQIAPFKDAFVEAGYPLSDGVYEKSIDEISIHDGIMEARIGSFHIAQYPVTNLQFQSFVDDPNGYQNAKWWPKLAKSWRQKNPKPLDSAFRYSRNPRENVNWFEAIAFCSWLGEKTGEFISLPTLPERLRVALAGQIQLYPWGNQFDKNRCNTREHFAKGTTPVDKYFLGRSPFGVMDLSGNVWEWSHPYEFGKDARQKQFAYGGGWRGRRRHARAAYSRSFSADYRAPDVGFRICKFDFR